MGSWRTWLIIACLLLALICYYLPWFTHATAGFTMNAFDLAEWTSIHPAVRSSSPPMLTSFLLRMPQLVLVVALALVANKFVDPRSRWILRGGAVLFTLRFFPPSAFFTSATDDPNYRQMALLTGLSGVVILVAIGGARLSERMQDGLLAIVLLAGVMAGWVGHSRAGVLLDNFEINVALGPGLIGWSAVSAVAVVLALGYWSKRRPVMAQ